jgi:PAS domain S-box-containing protein
MISNNTPFSSDLVDKEIRRLQTILDSVSSAVLEISAQGDIVYANQAAVQMLGFSQAEFKNRCVADLVPERYNRRDQIHLYFFLNMNIKKPTVKAEALSLLHKNGQELLVTIDLKPLVNSLQNSVIATFYESPNLKSTQVQLDNSNERLKVAKEAAQIGVFE